ncbi:hypothetical protein RHSIM_Rhsim10G0083000 [Rhododendron simsii]|uniref:CCHC-type domain-containing protein n=1 Tax=Rhododendron simsii TaxID=118357 RepID=A0A834LCY8_RHOSS|nr:hypothetical protein RHSIM_Rhsim10G0083000 [Rhododendron simsii]
MGWRAFCTKVGELWAFEKDYKVIDVGPRFFVIRFEGKEDYMKVFYSGTWAVMGHYLAVRKWEPNFRAPEAQIDITIDVETQARSARVCLEIELGKPLCHGLRLERGGDEYRVEYELTHSFCFNCGRVNHLKENCRSDSTGRATQFFMRPKTTMFISCSHGTSRDFAIFFNLAGYSSLAIALVLPELGCLVACERDAICLEVAKRYYE